MSDRDPVEESVGNAQASAGEPIVAEILDAKLNIVNRVSVTPGTDGTVQAPAGPFVVRLRVPDADDLFTRVDPSSSGGGSAVTPMDVEIRSSHTLNFPGGFQLNAPVFGRAARGAVSRVRGAIPGPTSPQMVEVSIASLFDEAALTVSSADSDRPATTARIALWEYAGEWKPAVLDALRPDGANRLAFSLQDRLCAVTVAGVRAAPFVTLLPPGEGHLAFDEPALDDPAPAVRIGLRDASAEAILRYLEAGATQDARLIAESAAASFQSADQVDVAAAMIGAYCLLRTGGHAHLKDWPEAAVTQYPWLPDTHVIFAAQMLRESGVPRFGRALQELLDAADAGIPIHSDGLRRLYDGLIAFRNTPEASDSSSSITKVIDRLTPYVAAMNRDRIYTSYYGSWPGAPAIVPDHDVGELELTNVDELTSG